MLFIELISRTRVESRGIVYILPLGANTPPPHLIEPLSDPNNAVVCATGSISNTCVELNGIPYILPFGANTPPIHLEEPL